MPGRLDEEQAAVHPSILNITFTLCSKLFSQVGCVLFFDVSHYRIPAATI